MGILKEMFSENQEDNFQKKDETLLSRAEYTNSVDMILSGYKTFQKKYVLKNVILKMLLVVLAASSSVMMLISSGGSDMRAIFMLLICAAIGYYFIGEPINNRKQVKKSAEMLEGKKFEIEITDRNIKITSPEIDEEMQEENNTENDEISDEAENEKPATVIHLDGSVDIIDRGDIFIICVSKKYVFIVPQDVFDEKELENTRSKLAAVMGIRYKIDD